MERKVIPFFKHALATLLLGGALSAHAQVSNYQFLQSASNYTPVASSGVIARATGGSGSQQRLDDENYSVTLPFSFNFNGTAYTAITVNTNGYITFGSAQPAATLTTPLSSAAGYPGAVAAFGTNLEGVLGFSGSIQMGSDRITSASSLAGLKVGQELFGSSVSPGTTITAITNGYVFVSAPFTTTSQTAAFGVESGMISTETRGTAPNRTFVIDWSGFQPIGTGNSELNFQIQLNEAGGVAGAQSVAVVYGSGATSTAGGAQVGLRGASNGDFNNRTVNPNLTTTSAGTTSTAALSYGPGTVFPAGLTYTWVRTSSPACSGTPVAGVAMTSTTTSCSGSLALMAPNATAATNITYQWQSSSSPTSGFTNIPGATTNPYTAPSSNAIIYYRLNVACGSGTPVSSAVAAVSNDIIPVSLGNDTTLCPGDELTLDAGNGGRSFQWSNGGTFEEITVFGAGSYYVRVTDPVSGCIGRDTINISAGQIPSVSLGPDRAICQGSSTILNAGNAGATYAWNTGASTQSISVNRGGTFSVTVTSPERCRNSDTINISVDPLPSAGLIAYNGVMPQLTFSVASPQNVTTYLWDFDDNGATSNVPTPTHTFSHDGIFNVRLTVGNNCGTDTVRESVRIFNAGNGVGHTQLDPSLISLYPNPATDYVTLQQNGNLRIESVEVLNIVGTLTVRIDTAKDKTVRIATGHLPAGTYLLRVYTDKGIVVKKMNVL